MKPPTHDTSRRDAEIANRRKRFARPVLEPRRDNDLVELLFAAGQAAVARNLATK